MTGIRHCRPGNSFYSVSYIKMMANSSSNSLVDRFPHLQREIRRLLDQDSGFSQLNEDYELLLRSLSDNSQYSAGDREDLVSLKISLEAEALEKLSRSSAWKMGYG